MNTKKAMALLRVSRPTLNSYVKKDKIKGFLKNGRYIYDDESIYQLLNNGIPRMELIYTSSSSYELAKVKIDQIQSSKLCPNELDDILFDYDPYFKNKIQFYIIAELVIEYKVKKVIMLSEEDLLGTDIELFTKLCKWHGTEIVYTREEIKK